MAAVGGVMDESYAERAKKATVQSNFRNNIKPKTSQRLHDAIEVPSASTSDTLDSSPAATNLMIPLSVPVSSASSENASPLPSANSLPPRNAWADRSPWRTPQKAQSPANSSSVASNGPTSLTVLDSPVRDTQHDPRSRLTSPVKAPTKSNQSNDSDPFVVNYNLTPSSLVDAQNWPQVGIATSLLSSPHRTKASLSSVSSTTMLSAPQNPVKVEHESENDATPSKKSKGEKTKWVAIPPIELQAAADEVKRRSRPGSSSSKSHSPHVNGRGPRPHDEVVDGRQGGGPVSRGDGPSPITTGNTRHDRNPSLTVPSSASSRRVSPLSLTTSLPSPSNKAILNPVPVPESPLNPREPSPSHPQSHNAASQRSRQNPAPFAFVEPFIPLHHPNRSSNHSRNPSQNPHPSSPAVFAPSWPVPVYVMPYYPPQNSYHVMPQTTIPPVPSSIQPQNETTHSKSSRLKRKRRPHPQEAVALAGYRSIKAEVLTLQDTGTLLVFHAEEEDPHIVDTIIQTGEDNLSLTAPTRDAWWSYGVDDHSLSRWLRRFPALRNSTSTGQQLSEGPHVHFGLQADRSTSSSNDSPVESAILQAGGTAIHQPQHSASQTYGPSWPAPGAGPSALDIGLAMGMPLPPLGLPPPPLLMSMPPPHSYLPSPASTTSRMDWTPRDDSFAPMPPPPHAFAYQQYGYSPAHHPNGHIANYSGDNQGRGNTRWREDRFTPRGGRGRGYNGRGRGYRGHNIPRPYNSQVSSPGGSSQATYPTQHMSNSATVYIPEPLMHPSMYPYPSPLAPSPFNEYSQAPEPSTEPSSDAQARPPSPKPLTQLNFHLDNTRFKLLGQIEYYFSRDNVAKDIYLRERMDSNGWVPIGILQSFPRIQRLNVSDDLIRDTLQWSHFVEVRHNHLRMAHDDWRNFVLPSAAESTVPEPLPHPWYPPPPFHPGYMAYPHPPQPYPYYHPPQKTSPLLQGDVADHILRRPEEKIFNANGNGVLESGTSAGDSFDSTPHTEGDEVETSEDDVVFLIGDPQPMQRPVAVAPNP